MSSLGEIIGELIGEAAGRLKIAGRCPAACCPADRASCTRAEGQAASDGMGQADTRQGCKNLTPCRPLARHDRHQRQAVTTGRTGHDHGKAARTLRRTHHNGPARLWPTDPCNHPTDTHGASLRPLARPACRPAAPGAKGTVIPGGALRPCRKVPRENRVPIVWGCAAVRGKWCGPGWAGGCGKVDGQSTHGGRYGVFT